MDSNTLFVTFFKINIVGNDFKKYYSFKFIHEIDDRQRD